MNAELVELCDYIRETLKVAPGPFTVSILECIAQPGGIELTRKYLDSMEKHG